MTRTRPSSPLLGAAFLALAAASCGGVGAPEMPYKHVLLISLDTTRADHFGCYGNPVVETPTFDALAREGVLFEQVQAAAPTTLASHTTIMTGLYPRRHGVARNGYMVAPENVMLAEVFQELGFHTAAFLGSFALDRMFDFNQGFLHFDQEFDIELSGNGHDQNQRRGDEVTDAVLAHVDEVADEDHLFLFAHYFDPHAPYDPPPPFDTRYIRPGGLTTSDLTHVRAQQGRHQLALLGEPWPIYFHGLNEKLVNEVSGKPLPGDEDLAALYAGEVSYLDSQIGRLLQGLRERGILQETLVVLTADHGETFWEHGEFWHHGTWVYQTTVHVPLIITFPDGRARGTRVATAVSSTDIFPTLLALMKLELPETVDGRSLVAAIDGEELTARPVFTEATQPLAAEAGQAWVGQGKPKCVRWGRWKFVRAPYLQLSQFFDLREDPGERVDLMVNSTPRSKQRLPGVRQQLQGWMKDPRPRLSNFNPTQEAAVVERLKDLGYLGGPDEAPLEGSDDGH